MVSHVTSLPVEGAITDQDVDAWLESVAERRPADDVDRLRKAISDARRAHRGQVLVDGMDRLLALLHTADTLNKLKLDNDTLLAAILSELPGQVGYDPEYLQEQYGPAVLRMVEQVALIREIAAEVHQEHQDIEKLRRLLLDIAADVRSILVLLAKRLRMMRRLKFVDPQLQREVASETRRVHAPLANRLGVWQLKWELEDLSLRFLQPEQYKDLAKKLDGKRIEREAFIASVVDRLTSLCEAHGIAADVTGRPKHINSIWNKMQRKGLDFEQVFDVRAVRVLVDTVAECYEVLGMAHGQWRPVPGEFDDYIAHPKPNGYSSLHTAVVGDDGRPLEIQVRTRDMHEHAERGVAAHWRYKENDQKDDELERRIAWMRAWLEQADENGGELAEQLGDNEFEARRIYILTPNSKVVELPTGATPVDFAYAIHTSVGHRCRGAKVNGRIVPLSAPLNSGDRVEVLTAKEGGPSRDWLNPHSGYVTTSRARNRIRHWFKQQDHDQHVQIGKGSLDRELTRLSVARPDMDWLAKRFGFKSADDLYAAIGRGEVSAIQAANTQLPRTDEDEAVEADKAIRERVRQKPVHAGQSAGSVVVEGVGDLMTQMAGCCKPVPYDAVVGYITRGRGVTVHRRDCHVVQHMDEANRARLVDVVWAEGQKDSRFMVDIQVIAHDRKGLLRDISSVFANADVDVLGVNTQSDRRHERASMRFTTEVLDMAELSRVMDQLSQIPDVVDVRRQV